MESRYLAGLDSLSMAQKTMLAKAKVQTVSELLLAVPSELAKKCRIPFKEMEALVDAVSKELAPRSRPLREVAHIGEEKFTTGDSHLDDVLGGGIRTGMLWEISGENNAGKTQLALQLALTVQLPQRLGGLSGAACYITTREELPTSRAQEMIAKHPLLSPQLCGLPDIFTVRAPFYVALQKVLTESVPAFADGRANTPGAKPAKLLIIDTFTDIFDHLKDERYEDTTLRARDLRGVSLILHRLASKYRLAVVILGGARDTFPRIDGEDRAPGELRYSDQSRWFARAHTLPGEDSREAVLGHVWPNQLNARIMMSRTIRTRPRSVVDPRVQEWQGGREPKRRRIEGEQQFSSTPAPDEAIPFRRFSVIFSSVGPPAFCDFVILDEGVIGIPPEEQPPSTFLYPTQPSTTSLSSVPTTQGLSSAPRSTASSSNSTQTPRYTQSLSYASESVSRAPSMPPPSQLVVTQSSVTTTATDSQAPLSAPSTYNASVPTRPPSTVPLSQSVVPSSQPDLDEDWDMYWKGTEGDDQLYANAGGQADDPEEAAETGPPVEAQETDSDYYWKDGNDDDALYTDL